MASDPQLLAIMPTTIGGGACDNETVFFTDVVKLTTPEAETKAKQLTDTLGVGLSALSLGNASCTVSAAGDQYDVEYGTFRAAGADPSKTGRWLRDP